MQQGDDFMKNIRNKNIDAIAEGISKYENSKKSVKTSDYSDLNTFIKDYLNTSEPKQRKKISDEFRKRHLELYEFLKSNQDLISAETEISKIIASAISGDTSNSDDKQLTNLFEIIKGGLK